MDAYLQDVVCIEKDVEGMNTKVCRCDGDGDGGDGDGGLDDEEKEK